jgi:hypothetical protein
VPIVTCQVVVSVNNHVGETEPGFAGFQGRFPTLSEPFRMYFIPFRIAQFESEIEANNLALVLNSFFALR